MVIFGIRRETAENWVSVLAGLRLKERGIPNWWETHDVASGRDVMV